MSQLITRKGSFDAAHRVVGHINQCRHIHGHLYQYELAFEFSSIEQIGYNIDFKEIKRIGCEWFDEHFDHGVILNPSDSILIKAAKDLDSKLWLMSLNGEGKDCNPSAENIAKEMFLALEILFDNRDDLRIARVRLYETPNCYTDCFEESISDVERKNFLKKNEKDLVKYRDAKGILEYDTRK